MVNGVILFNMNKTFTTDEVSAIRAVLSRLGKGDKTLVTVVMRQEVACRPKLTVDVDQLIAKLWEGN